MSDQSRCRQTTSVSRHIKCRAVTWATSAACRRPVDTTLSNSPPRIPCRSRGGAPFSTPFRHRGFDTVVSTPAPTDRATPNTLPRTKEKPGGSCPPGFPELWSIGGYTQSAPYQQVRTHIQTTTRGTFRNDSANQHPFPQAQGTTMDHYTAPTYPDKPTTLAPAPMRGITAAMPDDRGSIEQGK